MLPTSPKVLVEVAVQLFQWNCCSAIVALFVLHWNCEIVAASVMAMMWTVEKGLNLTRWLMVIWSHAAMWIGFQLGLLQNNLLLCWWLVMMIMPHCHHHHLWSNQSRDDPPVSFFTRPPLTSSPRCVSTSRPQWFFIFTHQLSSPVCPHSNYRKYGMISISGCSCTADQCRPRQTKASTQGHLAYQGHQGH